MAPKGTSEKEYIRDLEAVILTQKDLISNQEKQLSNQEKLISALEQKLERMNELLLNAQRDRFGQSSEKRDYIMPNQLGMFNEAETEQDHKAPEPTEETLTIAVPAGEYLGTGGRCAEPCHHDQLGDPDSQT